MDISFNILILLSTITLALFPIIFKELWKREHTKLKLFWSGKFFILAAIIGFSLGIYQSVDTVIKQKERDSTSSNTLNNTKDALSKLDNSLDRISILNTKLDSLEVKTKLSIERRSDILDNYNILNNKLEKLNKQQEFKVKESIPNINVLGRVQWKKNEDYYFIEVKLNNMGGRYATNFNIEALFLGTDSLGIIRNYKFLTDEFIQDSIFPVRNTQTMLLSGYPKLLASDSLSTGYLVLTITYSDFVTKIRYSKNKKFIWDGVKNKLIWRETTIKESDYVDRRIKKEILNINKLRDSNKLFFR